MIYLKKIRPVLYAGQSRYLFPGRYGGAKCAGPLRQQVSRAMRELIGRDFRPHLFRKIAPKIFLDRCPGEYDVVRRKLVHTSTRYTFSTYTGSEVRAAHRHFDRVILGLYNEANNRDPEETD